MPLALPAGELVGVAVAGFGVEAHLGSRASMHECLAAARGRRRSSWTSRPSPTIWPMDMIAGSELPKGSWNTTCISRRKGRSSRAFEVALDVLRIELDDAFAA